jgi:hypothetical protein
MSPMNPRLLRPTASGGFDPRRIAGLALWYDTLTPSTYTEASGQISEWRSKVGTFALTQATGNNRPTLFESTGNTQGTTRSEINGRQAFYFDGTNDNITSTSTLSVPKYTAFTACKPQDVTGVRGVASFDSAGGFADRGPQLLRGNGTTAQALGFTTAGTFVAGSAGLSSGTPAIFWSLQTASDLTVFLNGTAGPAVSGVQNSSTNAFRIGSATVASGFWLGAVGEVLVYDRDLTATEQLAVYNYLRSRWGFA